MTMEISTRSTSLLVLFVTTLLVLATVGTPVSAVRVADETVPETGEVGSKLSATVRLTDLYREPDLESWTLAGTTDLTDVTWTVTLYDQGGNRLRQASHDGQSLEQDGIDLAAGVSDVAVRVTGTVPPVSTYVYDPAQTVQTFTVASLAATRPGGSSTDIGTWEVHHYTAASREATRALDAAAAAIDAARASGATPGTAEETFGFAVDAYEGENFALATTLATQAESQAVAAERQAETNRLLLYVGGLVVALALLGTLVYWYQRRRRRPYDRLG
jgi:hypothetical protein